MNLEILTTIIVPLIATFAYFVAGCGNIWIKNYPLAGMWFFYSGANVCLLLMVWQKK